MFRGPSRLGLGVAAVVAVLADACGSSNDCGTCDPGLVCYYGVCVPDHDALTDDGDADALANDGVEGEAVPDVADDRGWPDEVPACPPGQTPCLGGCVDTATDRLHCGTCERSCRPDQICGGGTCLCPSDRTECSETCVDIGTDPENCGGCGNPCVCGTCSGGTCTSSDSPATFIFPDTGDTVSLRDDPYMWSVGDYYEGTRSTTLACATSVQLTLVAADNALTCDYLDLTVSINGLAIGTFEFPAFVAETTQGFTFPTITGPTYTIRLEVARSVDRMCGSVGLAFGTSNWTLR
jgi:hypothetical protein